MFDKNSTGVPIIEFDACLLWVSPNCYKTMLGWRQRLRTTALEERICNFILILDF